MKLGWILSMTAALVSGQTAEQTKMMNRFNRNKRLLNKWIEDNVDSRYRRFNKLQSRKNDYVKRMSWMLNSPCSALYVDDDELDQELDEIEGAGGIGARADLGNQLEVELSNGMKIVNTFKKLAKLNLSDCTKKPRINTKAEKLRQAMKKAAQQTDKLLKKKAAAKW